MAVQLKLASLLLSPKFATINLAILSLIMEIFHYQNSERKGLLKLLFFSVCFFGAVNVVSFI
jgi:hypothetical protein